MSAPSARVLLTKAVRNIVNNVPEIQKLSPEITRTSFEDRFSFIDFFEIRVVAVRVKKSLEEKMQLSFSEELYDRSTGRSVYSCFHRQHQIEVQFNALPGGGLLVVGVYKEKYCHTPVAKIYELHRR